MLARNEVAKVSNEAAGCTTFSQSYEVSHSLVDSKSHISSHTYTFYDTPGLNEGEQGNVPNQKALNNLYKLVQGFSLNLIIYCIAGSRLTDMVRVNYDLFWGVICEGRVPIVLVVTGLELESDMDHWWKRNEDAVVRMGMLFEGHACVTTTSQGGMYEKEFQVSRDKVWRLVQEHCSPVSWICSPERLAKIPDRVDKYMKNYNARSGTERKVLPAHARTRLAKVQTLRSSAPLAVCTLIRNADIFCDE